MNQPEVVPDPSARGSVPPGRAVIIGTGLVGTSVALALRDSGQVVWLADTDPAAVRLAAELGAGEPLPQAGPTAAPADLAVLAVPPGAVAAVLADAQARRLAVTYTDVASVKVMPLRGARDLGCDLSRYVPGHPLAGRERSGPAAARADLFLGRPWVVCPTAEATPEAMTAVRGLVRACGAIPVELDAEGHDQAVALVSHVPHLVASAVAAVLESAPATALALAGPGLRDVTRVAAGEPALWAQIVAANSGPVGRGLRRVAADLAAAADALATADSGDAVSLTQVTGLLERGRLGVARVPGKRGGPAPDYAVVQAVISDRPGELARLFAAVGQTGINVEDVGIEHSPGLPVGVAELYVRPDSAARLARALQAAGWPVRSRT